MGSAYLPCSPVLAVEDFKELILWAEEAPARVEELKKVLRLNQNYVEARDHAMLAVGRDCRLRFWTNAAVSHAGALFSANLGSIDLDHPAGLAQSHKCTRHLACDEITYTVRPGCGDWRPAVLSHAGVVHHIGSVPVNMQIAQSESLELGLKP